MSVTKKPIRAFATSEFFCILTADELREIADKADELRPAKETLQAGKECSDITARLTAYETGFDPETKKPMHYSDVEDEIVIFKDKMGEPHIGFFDPDYNKWYSLDDVLSGIICRKLPSHNWKNALGSKAG